MRDVEEKQPDKMHFESTALWKIKRQRRILTRWRLVAVLIIGLLSASAQKINPIHTLYIVQSLATAVLVWTLITKCRSAFILTLSAMFIAGNWLKLTIHKIFDYKYLEPTGFFFGLNNEWAIYHKYSISITLVLIIASAYSSTNVFFNSKTRDTVIYSPFIYHAAIFSTFFLYSVNWVFGIYRIGLGSRVELPLGLTAPISFLIFIGTPLIIALSGDYHVARSNRISTKFVISLSIAFIIGSISTYSRAIFITQFLPILVGMVVKAKRMGHNGSDLIRVYSPFILAMIGALILVSAQRIVAFSDNGIVNTESAERYFDETRGLIIERWVGAESMMAAAANDGNLSLFKDLIREDPRVGVFGIYHGISNSNYTFVDGKTFLNLPGYFAILALSGSIIIISLGTAMCCVVGILFERWVSRKLRSSEAVRYMACTALSYHFVQMAFPFLIVPFAIQIIAFIYFISLFVFMGSRSIKR